jgi:zinc protease
MYARVITSLLLLATLQIAAPPAAAAPRIQHWQSTGGAGVYFVPLRGLPIVDVQITFDAGSARDPEGEAGLALLTNSLLDEGAAGLDANAISFGFEKLGAQYGADADNDSASVSLRSLSDPKQLQPALANLQRVIGSPDFTDEALQRQRNRLLVAIQGKQQSPGALANDALQAAIYGDHPYATPTEGTGKSVQGLTRKAVQDFYQRYYTAGNATIVIVGDVDKNKAASIAESLARVLHKGAPPPPLPPVAPLTAAKDIHIPFDSTQTNIMLGQPGDYRGDPDYFTLYVGNHILGGGGFESRLTKEVRVKRGLSYYAYSYFIPWRRPGPFLAAAATRSREANESVAVMKQTITDYIKNGPTRKELKAAKDNIIGGFPLKIDSNSDIIAYVSVIGFYGLPLDYLDTFTRNVEAVTVKDIRSTFQRRLDVNHFVTVQVGPTASGEAQK